MIGSASSLTNKCVLSEAVFRPSDLIVVCPCTDCKRVDFKLVKENRKFVFLMDNSGVVCGDLGWEVY